MQLYPYQRAGAKWLADRDATTRHVGLLADGMGLGKSGQAVAAADILDEERLTVICPAIVCPAWRDTVADFGDVPREAHVVGAERLPDKVHGAVIASYERAQRPDVAEFIRRRGGIVVLDECHYLKDPGSNRTASIFPLAAGARRIVCLSGTPTPNHAGELYPLMQFAGLFRGEYAAFLQRYCHTRETDYGFQVLGHRNVEELRALLGRIMLRRRHQVVLPPTTYDDWRIDLAECDTAALRAVDPSTAGRVARAVKAGSLNGFDNTEVATLRRIIGAAKAGPVAKRVARLLDADATNKAVVFALHTAALDILARELAGYGVVTLSGDTREKQRRTSVDTFQRSPQTRVALCQMKAAGVGVTLTSGNHLVMCERPWSPADEDQALHRIIRIGQTRPTFVHKCSLAGSIDDSVNVVLQRKSRLIAEIVN